MAIEFILENDRLVSCRTDEAEITLPPEVRVVGSRAFSDCPGLRAVTLPHTVYLVQTEAFFHCPDLCDIYIEGRETKLGANLFCGMPPRFRIHYDFPDYMFRNLVDVVVSREIHSTGDYHRPSATRFEVFEELTLGHLFGEPEGGSFECEVFCWKGAVLHYSAQSAELRTEWKRG